ncbi:MAG TPA: EamA family transporter RarD [Kofleriaceae bacterium]|nr:EamA family transporter RarD [Kofleriaceae bacterium]
MNESRRTGWIHGVAAYALWGLVPVFWKRLTGVAPVEVLAHRAFWGLGAFALLVGVAGQGGALRAGLRQRRVVAAMALSSALVALNWGLFVHAVDTDRVLDASLGYFINPLLSVALGLVVLRERLRRLQWIAIALAASGVVLLTVDAGQLPWISLVLAGSFGLYGLVRKQAPVESLVGSAIETLFLAPVAAAYLVVLAARGGGALGHAAGDVQALLVATGFVTAVPLVLFNSAARRLPLATVGFLQYLAPTGQFLLAVLVYDEPFARGQLQAFACIWAGLAVFTLDALRARRAAQNVTASANSG